MSEKTQFHIQKLGQLRSDRSNFDTQWEEAASLIIPAHRNSFQGRGSDNAYGAQGQKKTELQYDSSVGVAAQRFASVIESLAATNPDYRRPAESKPVPVVPPESSAGSSLLRHSSDARR